MATNEKPRNKELFGADQQLDVSSKAIEASSLIIEHTVNFALPGNSHGPCNSKDLKGLFSDRCIDNVL